MGDTVDRKPTAKPTPAPKVPVPASTNLFFPSSGRGVLADIDAYLNAAGYTIVADVQPSSFLENLSDSQRATLASLVRKAGYTVRSKEELSAVLGTMTGLDDSNFNAYVKSLRGELIPKEGSGDGTTPRIDIYNVPDTELSADIDEASLAEIGAILSDEEKAKFLPIARKILAKGTRTTYSKSPKGEIVTNVTPMGTREMAKEAVTEAISEAPEYKEDVDRKQRIDFFKWTMGR